MPPLVSLAGHSVRVHRRKAVPTRCLVRYIWHWSEGSPTGLGPSGIARENDITRDDVGY